MIKYCLVMHNVGKVRCDMHIMTYSCAKCANALNAKCAKYVVVQKTLE